MLEDNGFHGTIKGVPDTSLMLDYYPRWSTDGCTTATACPVNTSLILAQEYWNSVSPERCLGDGWEPWQCYVGQYTLKTILTPIMPFQWLYEKSQLTLLGVPGRPSSHDGSLDYANDVADFYLTSFEEEFANMPQNGWFAPACFKHENVMDETWDQVGLNNTQGNIVRLSEAIRDFWAGNNIPRLSDSCRELDCNPEC
jgi:hypothetical protein